MPEVFFPSVEGVDIDHSIEGSKFSSLGAIAAFVKWHVEEVDPFMPCDEDAGFPLKVKEESLDSILINFKESRSDIDGNDV